MDNLNTHLAGSLYEAFEPAEAQRIAKRLEIHYTPKHGSWLNMAEIEFGVLSRQCLDRRIPDTTQLCFKAVLLPGKPNVTSVRSKWTGSSLLPMLALNSNVFTPLFMTVRPLGLYRLDGVIQTRP